MPLWAKIAIVAGCVGVAVVTTTTVRRPKSETLSPETPPTSAAKPPSTKPTGTISAPPPRVGYVTFAHVRVGMTFAEACRTIGGPPGFYLRDRHIPRQFIAPNVAEWSAGDATLTLRFDPASRVEKIDIRLAD